MNKKLSHKRLQPLLQDGKSLILACDQGFEHGPQDFNLKNINPEYIMHLALEGNFTAVAVQAGVAEKYYGLHYREVPLIVKLNGKTSLLQSDPVSRQHTSVKHAAELGAKAVGYTIYLGSVYEQEQFVEFGRIVEEAHELGLAVVLWSYPRGKQIKDDLDTHIIAYGARVGMELGADMIKLKYNSDIEGFKWVLQNAARTKVVISGGKKTGNKEFLTSIKEVIDAGGTGLAVGRNVWQHENPLAMAKALHDIIFRGKTVEQALTRF